MSYPYNLNAAIPQPGDDPSISQGQILNNFGSIGGWAQVDHIAYGSTNSGQHNYVNLPSVQSGPPTLSGTAGRLFTQNVGGAAQLFFTNSAQTVQLTSPVPINSIKASGVVTFASSGASPILANSYNVVSVSRNNPPNALGVFNLVLTTGVISSTNAIVLCSTGLTAPGSSSPNNRNMCITYELFNTTQLQISTSQLNPFGGPQDPYYFSFMILQF